ncbi:MAG: aminopeptidase [Raoultibacter sp.]
MERKNAWKRYCPDDISELEKLTADYIDFISTNKTERECAAAAIARAEAYGYRSLDTVVAANQTLRAGDKIWAHAYGKALILVHLGTAPLEEGLNILGAHIDSPRLDVKQNPLYETNDLVLLDTHYYGGIKKYQWMTIPLAIHGVIVKKTGDVIPVTVGEDSADPVFCVTDLLPHLARQQMAKTAGEFVEGDELDILVGSRPLLTKADMRARDGVGELAACDDAFAGQDQTEREKLAEKEPVKALLLQLLADKYDVEEEDFLSAELEVVPAGRARECGFDRSMVLGYGQDDRVCAFTSLIAQLEARDLTRTGVCVLVDKEEIGSVGATGMASMFFENTIAEVMALTGDERSLSLRRCLASSNMLSSDVSAAFDPTYAFAYETKNAAFCGKGLVFNKFTGSGGKSGSNDANAEYMAKIRSIMDAGEVSFQTAELGKVDVGGGGTIAYIPAKYGMNVIDSGVPVLSMHAPWEVTSKADIYEAYKGYRVFLGEA